MAYKITDRCKGCDDCAQVCPVMAITGDMKEKHEIDPERCIDCSACSIVCEYEGILDDKGNPCKFVPAEKRKKPAVDEKTCDGCGLCVEECPVNCLGIVGGVSTLVNAEACHGCGVCERRCPIEAVKLK